MSIKVNEDNSCYRCFICWDDIDFEDTSTKIVSACNCISTDFKYTHKECLNLWINQNRHAGLKCQVCGTPFHVKKVLKPFKKIYMENWKRINCLIIGMTLINVLIWLICIEWGKELERINGYCSESSNLEVYENLTKYDEWYISFDERESYLEDYIKEINLNSLYQNIYINSTTLILLINAAILILFYYHEKDKYVEYSIDENYEYKKHSKTPSNYIKLPSDQNKNESRLPNSDNQLSDNRNIIYNDYEYQKIRII